ncbi:MAG: accessory gene regulator B family protein [Clostridiales bacterium]|nr:accessory gene regulator B family protein [Clostridiales bacterium]
MDNIANWLTTHIKNNVPGLTHLQLIKIKFGIQCLLCEASKIIIYLVIFSFLSLTKEFIISLLFFAVIRGFAGGYHEDTYWRCFTTSFLILLSSIYLGMYLNLTMLAKSAILFASMGLVYLLAPVDHPNKPILSHERRKRLKYLSIIAVLVLGTVALSLPDIYSNVAVIAIFAESLSLLAGCIKKKYCITEKNNPPS